MNKCNESVTQPPAAGAPKSEVAAHPPPYPVKFLGSQLVTTDESTLIGTFYSAKGGPDYRPSIVRACNSHAGLHGLAVMCNAYLEPIADQLEICHKQPHEAKALRQLLELARAELAKAKGGAL
jgi:hypothetical protein